MFPQTLTSALWQTVGVILAIIASAVSAIAFIQKETRMTIRRELIDELLSDYKNPQDILGEGGLLKELTKAVVERCLETELDMHLGYPKHGRRANATGNSRNGQSQKILKGEQGYINIEVPRDRHSTFEPQLAKKEQTRLEGTDRENPGAVCTGDDHARH